MPKEKKDTIVIRQTFTKTEFERYLKEASPSAQNCYVQDLVRAAMREKYPAKKPAPKV